MCVSVCVCERERDHLLIDVPSVRVELVCVCQCVREREITCLSKVPSVRVESYSCAREGVCERE